MTTYTTIKEAFSNGTGDVFYSRDNRFLAVNDNDDNSNLLELGFTWLNYSQVLELAAAQTANDVKPQEQKPAEKIKVNNDYRGRAFSFGVDEIRSFYDEYPDAYGQNL